MADNPLFTGPDLRILQAGDSGLDKLLTDKARRGRPSAPRRQNTWQPTPEQAEREQRSPGSMWSTAHNAIDAGGWSAQILTRPAHLARPPEPIGQPGWMLILSDSHHCIHVEYVRSTDARFPDRVWRLVDRELRTRCPFGDRTHISQLAEWLIDHPADCAARRETDQSRRRPIGEMDYLPRACAIRHPHPGIWTGPNANPASIAADPMQNGTQR